MECIHPSDQGKYCCYYYYYYYCFNDEDAADDAEDDYDDIFTAFYKYVYTLLPWTVWNDHR